MLLMGPLEVIVGREARANPTAVSAAAGQLPAMDRQDRVKAETDSEYLGYMARKIVSLEQFNAMVKTARPDIRHAVKLAIWKKLLPEVQALIPDPMGGRPS
jgi:hypothetical protein